MFFITSYFEHLRSFTSVARALGAEGEFKLGSMNATLRVGDLQVEFLAQYLVRDPAGALTYSMQFQDNAEGFVGWLPYFNKRWVEAYDKLAFKKRCEHLKLPLPAWSVGRVAPELGDFLIKSAQGSSFGQRMRGPFVGGDAGKHPLQQGEYAEQFIPGQIGKAWFWNDRVAAIELREPAGVIGDGATSLAELVRRERRRADVTLTTDFFRYRNLDWSNVPAAGERVTVDYKYGSPYDRFELTSADRLEELANTSTVAELNAWGPLFWAFVPEHIRKGTLYTVDFVLSDASGLYLLEMNCNPTVPPQAYQRILTDALGSGVAGMDTVRMLAPIHVHAVPPPVSMVAAPQSMGNLPAAAPAQPAIAPPLSVAHAVAHSSEPRG